MPIFEMPTVACRRRTGGAGFTYVGVMVLVAVLALVATASVRLGDLLQRRVAEQHLLRVGQAYSNALRSYARATPPGQDPAPPSLQALLKDPRSPATLRHLRQRHADPLTGRADWGLVRDEAGGGILGVFSQAPGQPIKRTGFAPALADFAGRASYAEWVFTRPEEPDDSRGGPRKGLIRPADMLGASTQESDRGPPGQP